MKVSIIIPVYNVANYVLKCVDSCLQQDLNLNEYEIIIINDGSTDSSLEVLSGIDTSGYNVLIINQENKGLSGARNVGLKMAKGEYIWFIDSDDWIESNCLSKLYNICKNNELDFLHFKRAMVFDDGKIDYIEIDKTSLSVSKGTDLLISNLVSTPIQLYMIKRSFIIENKLYFVDRIYFEDSMLLPSMVSLATRCIVIPDVLYYHYQREGSITNSINSKHMEDLLFIIKNHIIKKSQYINDPMIYSSYSSMISVWSNTYVKNMLFLSDDLFNTYISIYSNERYSIIQNYKSSSRYKYIMIGYILSLFDLSFLLKVARSFHALKHS